MSDAFVQVLPDGSGKKIDNAQLSQDGGDAVFRQRVSIGDDANIDNHLAINADGSVNIKQQIGTAQLTALPINFDASGDNVLVEGSAGEKTRLYRLWLIVSEATILTFKDGSTPLSGPAALQDGGGITLDLSSEPWFETSTGADLVINSSEAVQISGTAYFKQA